MGTRDAYNLLGISDLMHDDKVRAMKLFIAKKKAEQAAKDTCHS